jgi:hypothetical protein
MNHGMSATIKADPNGALTIANDETTITIQPDGTVAISTEAPLQLVGRTAVKLDVGGLRGVQLDAFIEALRTRLTRKR